MDLKESSLSRPLDDLLVDANQAVENLNEFLADRNDLDARINRPADRIVDAIRSIALDRFNFFSFVYLTDLSEWRIRSYGGGLEGIRSLSDMVINPLPPLNPHFLFTRYNRNDEFDTVMSDLNTDRWDIISGRSMVPHIVPGGDSVVYVAPNGYRNAGGYSPLGVYTKKLGSTDTPELLTPSDLFCMTPSFSPDQTKIVFAGRYSNMASRTSPVYGPPFNLFVMDADGGNLEQITYDIDLDPSYDELGLFEGAMWPCWDPDGSEIIFSHVMFFDVGLYAEDRLEMIRPDGSERRVFFDRMTTGYALATAPKYSPDGSRIVFHTQPSNKETSEIIVVTANFDVDEDPPTWLMWQLTKNEANDQYPDWSYDMRYIVFTSDRGGEVGTLGSGVKLYPIYIMNALTGDIVDDLGDFTNAGYYFAPRFSGTQTAFSVVEGQEVDDEGNAVIDSNQDARTSDNHSNYNYYRETIPVANTIPNYNFGVTSWW
jgi:Tol biopolymer transport system component